MRQSTHMLICIPTNIVMKNKCHILFTNQSSFSRSKGA